MRERIFIEGQNIFLRALEKDDIYNNYIHWFDNSEVCKMNSHHRFPKSRESMLKYIENSYNSVNQLILAIIHTKEKTHIGNISLQNINYINRSSELAIIIGEKEYWGKGYGKEAATLIINHGFLHLNMNRIYCGTFVENSGMIKLAEALGFRKEGIRREAEFKNGKYTDIIEFGLLKSEWLK
ncbi:MAG: putative ribosomal N-acetyltransferase YdaF [Pelotomaculum sp. PtaU1.Bin035]|nr:MAG: putative ribosomal N-acetyltransferase YdaF [Pelotomaculum sp. PtaU1.Bin035]